MMRTALVAAVVVAGLAGGADASTLTDRFTGYYAFGDSLSDDGKLDGIIPFSSVSDDGRFSNGPVWTEIIGAEFESDGKQAANLALGGATAQGPDLGGLARLATFSGQIGSFADLNGLGAIFSGSNPLVSVWFGANDLFSLIGGGVIDETAARSVADAVGNGIRAIRSVGAQFDDFLVLNMPDLGRTPRYTTLDPFGTGPDPADASLMTGWFNDQLALTVEDLRSEGLTVAELDIFTLFETILDGPRTGDLAVFDGMNLTVPCTVSLTDPTFPTCADPDLTLFVDAVHPNRIAHEVFAARALALQPVPLPAGAPLLLAGLLAFGVVARRRAA